MKTVLISSIFLLFTLVAQGQRQNQYSYFLRQIKIPDNSNTKIDVSKTGDTILLASYKSLDVVNNTQVEFTKAYKGTPFFKNAWFKGTVNSDKGKNMEFVMAYNVEKSLLYLVEDPQMDAIGVRPPDFTIAGHTFKLNNGIYHETIYEDRSKLIKEHVCLLSRNKSFEKTGYETEGGETDYEGEFMKMYKYFLVKNEELIPLIQKKKILRLFGNKKADIEKFILKNNIDITKEPGLIATFKYYDSLVQQ